MDGYGYSVLLSALKVSQNERYSMGKAGTQLVRCIAI
jgi:hypothetical protein